MNTTAQSTGNIAEAAALIGWTLRNDDRWDRWYDPDRWGGMVGIMHHAASAATALEEQLGGREWSDLDWYSTIDAVVGAMFDDTLDLADMSERYVAL